MTEKKCFMSVYRSRREAMTMAPTTTPARNIAVPDAVARTAGDEPVVGLS
jgi:hypothetical protein